MALAIAYGTFHNGESLFKGKSWALSGSVSLVANQTITWRDVAPGIVTDMFIGYADRMFNRSQIAVLHTFGNTAGCYSRSPISVDVNRHFYNLPGLGPSPITAGVTSYTRTCSIMKIEVSKDGGQTWTPVDVKVCEIKAA